MDHLLSKEKAHRYSAEVFCLVLSGQWTTQRSILKTG